MEIDSYIFYDGTTKSTVFFETVNVRWWFVDNIGFITLNNLQTRYFCQNLGDFNQNILVLFQFDTNCECRQFVVHLIQEETTKYVRNIDFSSLLFGL